MRVLTSEETGSVAGGTFCFPICLPKISISFSWCKPKLPDCKPPVKSCTPQPTCGTPATTPAPS